MKFVKVGLLLTAISLFIFACAQNSTTNDNGRITHNANGTTVSYNAATPDANANSSANAPVDELASARKIYKEKCIACHQESGEGGQVTIEGKSFKVPSFKKPGAMNLSDKDMTKYITKGDDEMPAFEKELTPEEIQSMVKLIRKDFQGK